MDKPGYCDCCGKPIGQFGRLWGECRRRETVHRWQRRMKEFKK